MPSTLTMAEEYCLARHISYTKFPPDILDDYVACKEEIPCRFCKYAKECFGYDNEEVLRTKFKMHFYKALESLQRDTGVFICPNLK